MARVISIGQFAGGSFGCMFNPSTTREFFAVEGDRDPQGFPKFAHTSRKLVEDHAAEVQAERDASRARENDIRARNAEAVRTVSAILTREGIASPLARLGGKLLPAERLAPECAHACAMLQTRLGAADWDAQTEDGKLYRVRTAHPYDYTSGGIVPIVLVVA